MNFLYTLKYYNKYYKEDMTCEFQGDSESEAKELATDRINKVDSKYIDTPYTTNDFTLDSIDETIILQNKVYKTRSGLRVDNISINPDSTTQHNTVSGHIFFKNKKGEEKKRGEWALWSLNGRNKAVGIDSLDLVLV